MNFSSHCFLPLAIIIIIIAIRDRNENISQSLLLQKINIRRLFSSLYVRHWPLHAFTCLNFVDAKKTHTRHFREILIILRSQQTIKIYFWSSIFFVLLSRQTKLSFSLTHFHSSGELQMFVDIANNIEFHLIHACCNSICHLIKN